MDAISNAALRTYFGQFLRKHLISSILHKETLVSWSNFTYRIINILPSFYVFVSSLSRSYNFTINLSTPVTRISYSPVSPSAAVIWVLSAVHPIESIIISLINNKLDCGHEYSTIFLYFVRKM